MKGKIIGTLFGLPFFAVGVWMLWSISTTFYDAWQTRNWVDVDATLITAGYKTHRGDDSDSYEAYARYRYSFGGQIYAGERVAIGTGGDNIGDFQQDLGRRLSAALAGQQAITVYVNADAPAESIVDRSVRWGLVGFKSIFLILFGGIGLFVLIATWRMSPEKDPELPEYQQEPWLMEDRWQTATILSSSKSSMLAMWAFAGIWNLISAPLPFLLVDEVLNKKNYIALVGLLFPVVGVGFIVWAVRRTLEWRRFGKAPVTLDPFPGSIGGHVGGRIELNVPFDATNQFQVTLTCIHSYVSGSGKNRSRRESASWQDKQIAHATSNLTGSLLTFRFDVPEDQHASDIKHDDSYYLWRLNLRANLAGTDLDRDYDIPVFATAQQSQQLSDRVVQEAQRKQDTFDDQAVRKQVNLRYDAGGKSMYFPMGRHIGSTLGGFIIGAIFAAVGWYLIIEEGRSVFGGVFAGVGSLIAIFSLYMMFNSLEVKQDATGLRTIRRWLGIPIRRRQLHRSSFRRFKKNSNFQSQGGGKHVVYYSVYAVDSNEQEIVLGEGFNGESEANAAIRLIGSEFGMQEARPRDAANDDDGYLGPDALTAD